MERFQTQQILNDLNKKMVFITGPRQVGKTWLAKHIAAKFEKSVYLNYDHAGDRQIIRTESWLDDTQLLILDELHKMTGWKNYLKGVYDTKPETIKILVTGSARLEAFRQQGDSLAGRFFRHRLLPFSPSEIKHIKESIHPDLFLTRGGFPEPLLAGNDVDAERWRMQYIDGLIRTDILDFERISDLRAIQLVLDLLRERTGSPVSYQSISEDVGIAPNTVKKYLQILESLYIIFRVTPYAKNIARSISKMPKVYFYDTGMVIGDNGTKLENMAALCLYKHVCGQADLFGKAAGLNYLRTKDGAEVDFCLTQDNEPRQIIEVKYSDASPAKPLINFANRYHIPATQIVFNLRREQKIKGVEVRRAIPFFESLTL